MKKYVVKMTQFDLNTGNVNVFFMAKDGYVHDLPEYADGWKVKRFAEDYIQRDMKSSFTKPYPFGINNAIEYNRYINHYEIVEIEQEND